MMDRIFSPLKDPKVRQLDATGGGEFGDPRGDRWHKGLDLVGEAGEAVYAPFAGQVKKIGYVYAHNDTFRLVDIGSGIWTARLFYVDPLADLETGQLVTGGQKIGFLQDVAGYWNLVNAKRYQDLGISMVNHLHFEMKRFQANTDPYPFIYGQKSAYNPGQD